MGNDSVLETEFALAERASQGEVSAHFDKLTKMPLLQDLMRAIPNIVLVMNQKRQIVFANERLLEYLQLQDVREALGQRPGELFDCTHAFETEGGCGTTRFCRHCGAVRAILHAQQGHMDVQECRILQSDGKALDLRVWATPLTFNDEHFVIFAVMDIEDEKRRAMLERTFFHDILNTASIIRAAVELLPTAEEPETTQQLQGMLLSATRRLIGEIEMQNELVAAEQGELQLAYENIEARAFLHELARIYATHKVAIKRHIEVTPIAEEVVFQSDPRMLARVLGNLIKNALEASKSGETVTLHCGRVGDAVRFLVHNPSVMRPEVQEQVFQRSFSTKGKGRGIGTYSIKLLTEQYLHGEVAFKSKAGEGTTFVVTYPLHPPRE
ncbi:MAG: ATP-binding protein [Anaerolineae bacterium]